MELHSYAKRKVAKKWTIDQKRQLVDARINNDIIFQNMPTASVTPWKKILNLAKLDDHNVFFVRKQWSNMVNKYKQYKLNRLDVLPNVANNTEEIQKISQEWEFFEPIHRFMSHKTTNLHSYALPITIRMPLPTPAPEKLNDNHSSNSSVDDFDAFSTDTNASNDAIELNAQPNTDHDFYTKKNGIPLNYFADVSNDTQESMFVEQPLTCNGVTEGMEQVRLHVVGEQIVEMKMEPQSDTEKNAGQVQVQQHNYNDANIQQMPSTSGNRMKKIHRRTVTERQLNEKDRYYRHKRRFNRRIERRFDAILNVFGQIVKAEYPNINVSPLIGTATQTAGLVNQLFKSENDDDSPEEEIESSTDTEQMQFTTCAEERLNEINAKNELKED